MHRLTRILATVFLATLLIGLISSAASACPTCQNAIAENDPNSQSVAAGYFYSILFMMSMPFLILGTFGSAAYFSIRRAREQQLGQHESLPEDTFRVED